MSKQISEKITKRQPIPFNVAVALQDSYEAHRTACTMPQIPGSDGQTKWVWFSIKELERLFEIAKTNYPDPQYSDEVRGVKMYFAVYPEKVRVEDGIDYKDRLTLVLVPSIKKTGDIYEDHPDTSANPAITDNVGAMCPPRCLASGDILK